MKSINLKNIGLDRDRNDEQDEFSPSKKDIQKIQRKIDV